MTILFALLATFAAIELVWLVATRSVTFPVLFDAGMSLIVLGLIPMIDSVLMREAISGFGAAMIGVGVVALLSSYARQTRKYNREHRYSNPRKLSEGDLRNIPGGKK